MLVKEKLVLFLGLSSEPTRTGWTHGESVSSCPLSVSSGKQIARFEERVAALERAFNFRTTDIKGLGVPVKGPPSSSAVWLSPQPVRMPEACTLSEK